MEPADLNLTALVALAGAETERTQLGWLAAAGFPGLRRSYGHLFRFLTGDRPTITALAGALGITQQGASKQVRELAELGYVQRYEVAGDLRARTVGLTAKGRASVEYARRGQAELERKLIARVGDAKVAAAKETLVALLELVGTPAEPTP